MQELIQLIKEDANFRAELIEALFPDGLRVALDADYAYSSGKSVRISADVCMGDLCSSDYIYVSLD